MVQKVRKTVEIPQVQDVEKYVQVPQAQIVEPVPVAQFMTQDVVVPVARPYRAADHDADGWKDSGRFCRCASGVETPRDNHSDKREDVERYSDVVFRSWGRRTGCGAATDACDSEDTKETEVKKKIVQTVLDEPKTWSPEAKGEIAQEKDRVVERGDGYIDCWVEVYRKRTRASQREPSKSKQSGRTSEGAGRQGKENKVNNEEMPKEPVSQKCAKADGKTVVRYEVEGWVRTATCT